MKTNNKLRADEIKAVRHAVWHFVTLLERLQGLPLPLRLYYYGVAFDIYEILRKHKQLGRRVGVFDYATMQEIREFLTTKFDADGRDED